MVDTGAVCSILPHRSKAKPTSPPLSSADGKDSSCWGRIRCRLTFGMRTVFRHLFARRRLQTHTSPYITKTAIIMSFGLFEYLFMPFGLCNAAQTFQRFMDRLLKHLPFVFCYLDNLIIASHTLEEHHEHLRQIFTILQENGLQINPAMCVFDAAAAVEFLDHRVGQQDVRPLQWHVQAIREFPPPPLRM
jgi:hypothetical protein